MASKKTQKKWKKIENKGGWEPVDASVVSKVKARNAALKSSREAKDGKINMRVSSSDIEALKEIAHQKGIAYQALLGMIIHQYINGSLVDIKEIQKVLKVG